MTCGCLREQAKRCRDILGKLTELSAGGEPFDRMRLTALIEEVVAPHRNFGVAIDVSAPSDRAAEPVGARNPAILYGLGNLLENAVDFAHDRVLVDAKWDEDSVAVTISDDGPGFAPEIIDPNWRTLCHQPPAAPERYRRRTGGAGSGLLHRQDAARALGCHVIV